jgi:hypothetical protein
MLLFHIGKKGVNNPVIIMNGPGLSRTLRMIRVLSFEIKEQADVIIYYCAGSSIGTNELNKLAGLLMIALKSLPGIVLPLAVEEPGILDANQCFTVK